MVGRVYRVDTVGEGPRGRTSFEFDALDETRLDGEDVRGLFLSGEVAPFGLIRVLTTLPRFAKLFDAEPREGGWYRLELTPREALGSGDPPKLTAWHAQLTEGGYTRQSRGYVTGFEFLSADEEPPLKPLSAGLSPAKAQQQAAIASAQFPEGAKPKTALVGWFPKTLKAPHGVKVHDVGQASFVTLFDGDDDPIAHFDAGWPIVFNGKTAPSNPPLCLTAPVILSHWDWDHLSGYYRFPTLQTVPWIAPIQQLGFGAGRIAAQLDALGLLAAFDEPPLAINGLTLGLCHGPTGNKNQTGLALRVTLPGQRLKGAQGPPRAVLLTGDADYDSVPAALTAQPLDALVVTHHGAHFDGQAPLGPAGGRGRAGDRLGRKGQCLQAPQGPSPPTPQPAQLDDRDDRRLGGQAPGPAMDHLSKPHPDQPPVAFGATRDGIGLAKSLRQPNPMPGEAGRKPSWPGPQKGARHAGAR